jgi:hypothetical protein
MAEEKDQEKKQERIDADSPWKEIIEKYFPEFMKFFFPAAYDDIDWDRGYEFLEKEFQQIVRDAELGRRIADKLAKVFRKNGNEAWVYVHVEVQGHRETEFSERIYVYNYRIFDRYKRPVASFVVFCDEDEGWRPEEYSYELWGSRASLRFSTAKLIEYDQRWAELEQNNNPFAVVVMAHIKSRATKKDANERLRWKLTLVKLLYQKGFRKEDILELFRFIDWVMALPEELEEQFGIEIEAFEEEQQMSYVTSIEKIGIKKGKEEGLKEGLAEGWAEGLEAGLREGIKDTLEVRFEAVSEAIQAGLDQLTDAGKLRAAHRKALQVGTLEEFAEYLAKQE